LQESRATSMWLGDELLLEDLSPDRHFRGAVRANRAPSVDLLHQRRDLVAEQGEIRGRRDERGRHGSVAASLLSVAARAVSVVEALASTDLFGVCGKGKDQRRHDAHDPERSALHRMRSFPARGGAAAGQDAFRPRRAVANRGSAAALRDRLLVHHLIGARPGFRASLIPRPIRSQKRPWRASRAAVPAVARYLIHRRVPITDVRTLLAEPGLLESHLAAVDRPCAESQPDATDLDQIQEVMIRTFLSENILCFADSVAMNSSAELRMPYLDRDLVEDRLVPSCPESLE